MTSSNPVECEETSFRGYRAIRLASAELVATLVPEVGGRILSITHRGEELLFVHEEHMAERLEIAALELSAGTKRQVGFRLWGGDKTWISPQSSWSEAIPPLDLDAGRYAWRCEGQAIVMESPSCRETELQVARRVELRPDGELLLDERIVNVSKRTLTRGIWNVTQVLRPFDVYLPIPLARVKAYPDEGESVTIREALLDERQGWTRVPCGEARHFKFGGVATRGVVVALRPGRRETLAHVRRFDSDPTARYAHEASVEVYNSPAHEYLEIEVHAPLRSLAPGEASAQHQSWRFGRLSSGIDPDHAARLLS